MTVKASFKILLIFFLCLIAGYTTYLASTSIKQQTTSRSTTTPQVALDNEVEQVIEPSVTEVTIGMIGDILLHYPIYTYPDFTFAFDAVSEQMQSLDFLLANQESMPAGEQLGLSTYPSFNSPPHIIRDLQKSGVDFVTIANNHTLDKGEQQVLLTIQNLQSYNMPYTGAFASKEDQQKARIINVEDIAVGILAYTYGTNTYVTSHPDGKDYLVSYLDEAKIIADVKALRSQVDFIVLSLHWGEEYNTAHNEQQQQLAKNLFAAGADAIFGHHPHVLQPFEWIEDKPVFYSLGNFYSAQPWAGTNVGGIARLTLRKTVTANQSTTETVDAHFLPTTVVRDVYNGHVDAPAFRVMPLQQYGNQMGWDNAYVEQHIGLPTWH